jgi:uncharacterized protein YaiI (UPF0178 family)
VDDGNEIQAGLICKLGVQKKTWPKLTEIYVDADACPVREEIYRVAARLHVNVFVVSNGSRPVRPPGRLNISMIIVGNSLDAADDWIAERIRATDVCVTSDILLASRCLKRGARVISPIGKQWTEANIGNALAGRDIARHLRESGEKTRGPAPLTKQDRSRFLSVLDTALQAALREAAHS